ncbi:phosphocarrier protein kinase/phosphorylase [Klebsiella pneumoniae]|uniref:Phosphocarrier protein kinase/phosphorylase n=1 Tax=Klebsiella pneumoniae TaxID=573 RepID=A0A378FNR9_KLEPN|nr:phosphocarrier protein kinase/phosphorylase [Klebsiella pneumoniae]
MFNSKPVTLRTLDIGADKTAAVYADQRREPVPRLARDPHHPRSAEIFLIQVRAMLRANAATGNSAFCCRW